MTGEGLEVDQLDLAGNTPLHLAARTGNTNTASTLLNHGARVNMKVSPQIFSEKYSRNISDKIRVNLTDSLC